MAYIDIEGMGFYSYHGCFAEESKIGTRFSVDVRLELDTSRAQASDDIADTCNYLSVYQTVKEQMDIPSRLLEHVADRIASAILDNFHAINSVKVKVAKLNPPLGGQIASVAVTVEKSSH